MIVVNFLSSPSAFSIRILPLSSISRRFGSPLSRGEQGGGYSGFQVTGMMEGFLGGLKFSIPGFFWVRKFGKYVFLASLT